jgi:DNA-binding NarL/FixJ family response regulator
VIRVLLVDDQELVRTGFSRLLREVADIEVVGEAADGATAVAQALQTKPDVALMDVRMPGIDGVEATARIIRGTPSVRVLMLTTFDLDEAVHRPLEAGASGFLLKDTPYDQLIHAIRVVSRGDAVLAPSVTWRLIESFAPPPVDQKNQRLRKYAVVLHRVGHRRVLHSGHDHVQVSDIHQHRDLCAVLGVDEGPDVCDSERAEDLFTLRRGKPVVCVLDIVVPDDGGHAASLRSTLRACAQGSRGAYCDAAGPNNSPSIGTTVRVPFVPSTSAVRNRGPGELGGSRRWPPQRLTLLSA